MESRYQIPTKPCSKAEVHAFWSKVVADQISSKIDMQKFCNQHQLKFTSLRYWKYTSKIGKVVCKEVKKGKGIESTKFVPLQIASASNIESKANNEFKEIKLIFNNGHKLVLSQTISEANLSMIIKMVAVLPC